jgi:hypothetical protein
MYLEEDALDADSMKNRRNYYRLLQVQPDAAVEVIRGSFRALMRDLKQHPDLGGSNGNAALLNQAYETLIDPKRRADYDRSLCEQSTEGSSATTRERKFPLNRSFYPFSNVSLNRVAKLHADEDAARAIRRSFARTKRNERIFYSSNGYQWVEGQMIDFSPGGILFLCAEYIPVKSVTEISSSLFKATVCVTHCRERTANGKKLHAIGGTFLKVRFDAPKGVLLSTTA